MSDRRTPAKPAEGVRSMEGLGTFLSEQIDIRAFEKLGRLGAELGHERLRFLDPNLDRLIFFQDDFKLQESAKAFDSIEVHTRSAEGAFLLRTRRPSLSLPGERNNSLRAPGTSDQIRPLTTPNARTRTGVLTQPNGYEDAGP
jgi:hypothetical protein